MSDKWLPIKDQLDFACMQILSKKDIAIDGIELSYEALDTLIATDPPHMRHVPPGRFEWQDFKLKPMDGFIKGGLQYRIITRPRKPLEVGRTIRGKLP